MRRGSAHDPASMRPWPMLRIKAGKRPAPCAMSPTILSKPLTSRLQNALTRRSQSLPRLVLFLVQRGGAEVRTPRISLSESRGDRDAEKSDARHDALGSIANRDHDVVHRLRWHRCGRGHYRLRFPVRRWL